jgi:hypothetical protein
MQQETVRRPAPIAAIVTVLGGALLVVGSFLTWAELSGSGINVTAQGTDTEGWWTFAAGALVFLAGILLFVVDGEVAAGRGRRIVAALAIVAGLAGGVLGVYKALTAEDEFLDAAAEELAPQAGGSPEQVRALLDQAIDADQLGVSLGIGLYLVMIGGVVGLVGGALGLRRRAAVPAAAMEAPTPAAPAPAESSPMVGSSTSSDPPTESSTSSDAAPPTEPPAPQPPAPESGSS